LYLLLNFGIVVEFLLNSNRALNHTLWHQKEWKDMDIQNTALPGALPSFLFANMPVPRSGGIEFRIEVGRFYLFPSLGGFGAFEELAQVMHPDILIPSNLTGWKSFFCGISAYCSVRQSQFPGDFY